MIEITIEGIFSAAHKLTDHQGKCKNDHGHNYKVHATIAGEPDENGILMRFGDFKKIVQERVFDVLDHRYINGLDIPEFKRNPTVERMCRWSFYALKDYLPNLKKIKIWETEKYSASYFEQ